MDPTKLLTQNKVLALVFLVAASYGASQAISYRNLEKESYIYKPYYRLMTVTYAVFSAIGFLIAIAMYMDTAQFRLFIAIFASIWGVFGASYAFVIIYEKYDLIENEEDQIPLRVINIIDRQHDSATIIMVVSLIMIGISAGIYHDEGNYARRRRMSYEYNMVK